MESYLKNLISFLSFFCILSTSCEKKESTTSDELLRQEVGNCNEHTIPINIALSNLDTFLCKSNEIDTKSSSHRMIRSVSPIKFNLLETKSQFDSLDCENLIYLVNFSDNRGYAILSADDRIQSDIITIVDNASISGEELVNDYLNFGVYNDSYSGIIDTTAFYSLGESSGISDRIIIGDFIDNSSPLSNESSYRRTESLINSLAISYAIDQVSSNNITQFIGDIGGTCEVGDIENGGTSLSATTVLDSCSVSIVETVAPILVDMNDWHQSSPFNDALPATIIQDGEVTQPYVGCVNLAVSRIIALFEWPQSIPLVNYSALKNNHLSSLGSSSAANLCKFVDSKLVALYFSEGTFIFPLSASGCLQSLGYPNTNYKDFSTSDVGQMLLSGKPAIVCGIPHVNGQLSIENSHAWNVDGYIQMIREEYRSVYINDNYSHSYKKTFTEPKMFHCDFGWGGKYNGYFSAGIFDLADSHAIFDDVNQIVNDDDVYDFYLKEIIYDKPY